MHLIRVECVSQRFWAIDFLRNRYQQSWAKRYRAHMCFQVLLFGLYGYIFPKRCEVRPGCALPNDAKPKCASTSCFVIFFATLSPRAAKQTLGAPLSLRESKHVKFVSGPARVLVKCAAGSFFSFFCSGAVYLRTTFLHRLSYIAFLTSPQ